jgi:ankyrin repeat protein
MTALFAAVSHGQRAAVVRLLDAGADVNRVNAMFGAAVHTAAGAGDATMLELLLDRGGDASVPNAQGQTPLAVIAASRASIARLAQAQELVRSLGGAMPAFAFPTAGWDACAALLKKRGHSTFPGKK